MAYQETKAQAPGDLPIFKTLTIRQASKLCLGKTNNRINVWMPKNTELVEVAREDKFWAKIHKSENLKELLLKRGIPRAELNRLVKHDWYFKDQEDKNPDGYDSDPLYFLENWISKKHVRPDAIELSIRNEVDPSLWNSLIEDYKKKRIDFTFDVVLSGNKILVKDKAPQFSERKIHVRIPDLKTALAGDSQRITLRWGNLKRVQAEDTYLENPFLGMNIPEMSAETTSLQNKKPQASGNQLKRWMWLILVSIGLGVLIFGLIKLLKNEKKSF